MRGNLIVIAMLLLVALLILGLVFLLKTDDADRFAEAPHELTQKSPVDEKAKVGSSQVSESAISNKETTITGTRSAAEELVVDQSAVVQEGVPSSTTPGSSEGKVLRVPSALGVIKEEIRLELTLFNSIDQKPLAGLAGEVRIRYANHQEEKAAVTSDENGKVSLKASYAGYASIQFSSKAYSIYSAVLSLKLGKNEHIVQLKNGGILEVTIKTLDHQVVEGVVAEVQMTAQRREMVLLKNTELLHTRVALNYDSTRGVYIVDHLAEGWNSIGFKASGYMDTTFYSVDIHSDRPASLEILLLPVRKILFDLDLANKPNVIYLSETQILKTRQTRINNQIKISKEIQKNLLPSTSSSSLYMGFRGDRNAVLQQGAGPSGFRGGEQKALVKNKDGLYEYEFINPEVVSVLLFAEKYVPAEIVLAADRDLYKVSLHESVALQLYLKNEKDEPIAGAAVRYSANGVALSSTTSDAKGVAMIDSIEQATIIQLQIYHKDYAAVQLVWNFEGGDVTSKTVTLLKGYKISGRVLSQGKSVANTKVFLYRLGSSAFLDFVVSDRYGEFSFQSLGGDKDTPYTIKAFHKELGVAIVSSVLLDGQNKEIDLDLREEKTGVLKLVTAQGKALSEIGFNLTNTLDAEFSIDGVTDENGLCQLTNMLHGSYYLSLNSDQYDAEREFIQLPTTTIAVVAQPKNLHQLRVTMEDGSTFKGALKANFVSNTQTTQEISLITDDRGSLFLDIREMQLRTSGFLCIQAQGYVPVILGRYSSGKAVPKELVVQLKQGNPLTVRVTDDRTGAPLAGIMVEIYAQGVAQIQALPTNSLGEVLFRDLPNELNVVISASRYSVYNEAVKVKDLKVLDVRLKHGGGIKGHMTLSQNIRLVSVRISGSDHSQTLNGNGEFSFIDLPSGNYTLEVTMILKDNRTVRREATNLLIEEDKVLEVNLDNYIKE